MYAPMCEWKDWKGRVFVTDVDGRMYWINKPAWEREHEHGRGETETITPGPTPEGVVREGGSETQAEIG